MSLVKNIKSLCDTDGLSIPKLERELGFSKGSIYNWDSSSPAIEKIQKVANYFKVSVDRVIYGFDLSEFSNLVDTIKWERTLEQFANDTEISAALLFDITLGLPYERPSLELIKKLISINKNDLITEDDLLEAAGYPTGNNTEIAKEKLIELLVNQYEEAGFSLRFENDGGFDKVYVDHFERGSVASLFLHELLERGDFLLENLIEKYPQKYEPETLAAHHEGQEWTEEELKEIERFKEFVHMKRRQQENKE